MVALYVMRMRRTKVSGVSAVYHCMTRTVNGEMLFKDREKEMLRKMLWQVAEFCGAEILTYCVMTNHFHVLLRIPEQAVLADVGYRPHIDLIDLWRRVTTF